MAFRISTSRFGRFRGRTRPQRQSRAAGVFRPSAQAKAKVLGAASTPPDPHQPIDVWHAGSIA
jgi:hypothetical protein